MSIFEKYFFTTTISVYAALLNLLGSIPVSMRTESGSPRVYGTTKILDNNAGSPLTCVQFIWYENGTQYNGHQVICLI